MKRCDIPACTLPPCDLEWGHDGDMHSNGGDGFYARDYEAEHRARQRLRGGTAPVEPKARLRFVEVRGARYLHIDDVSAFVRELGGGEETDVRNRLNEAADRLKKTS